MGRLRAPSRRRPVAIEATCASACSRSLFPRVATTPTCFSSTAQRWAHLRIGHFTQRFSRGVSLGLGVRVQNVDATVDLRRDHGIRPQGIGLPNRGPHRRWRQDHRSGSAGTGRDVANRLPARFERRSSSGRRKVGDCLERASKPCGVSTWRRSSKPRSFSEECARNPDRHHDGRSCADFQAHCSRLASARSRKRGQTESVRSGARSHDPQLLRSPTPEDHARMLGAAGAGFCWTRAPAPAGKMEVVFGA